MNFEVLKNNFDKEDKRVLTGLSGYFIILVLIAFNACGTCDSGDSIVHFLFSKYAFLHPENFLDHWAKPLFVLLSAPFAQFGFIGLKLFNCGIAAITAWYCFKTAKTLHFKNAWLAAVFFCFTPGYFTHVFSGLTEPLFAFVLLLGVYLILKNQVAAALCAVSFLPFVRSEGLVIIGVFAVYLVLNKQFKYLPLLLSGHIFYSIAGVFYYHDLLWVFNKIPYSESSGKYGHGNITHFVVQLNYIIGVPLYALLALGFVKKVIELFSFRKIDEYRLMHPEVFLIYGSFLAFITAHSLFWYFGIFESMGLNRVLAGVVPLAIIISLKGFNFITGIIKQKVPALSTAFILAAAVIVFPFVPNPASVNWEKDLSLSDEQLLVTDAYKLIKVDFPENTVLYYTHPYLILLMNRDPFDVSQNHDLKMLWKEKRPAHYMVVWDNQFSLVENGVTLEQLMADKKLKLIKNFKTVNKGEESSVAVFEGND